MINLSKGLLAGMGIALAFGFAYLIDTSPEERPTTAQGWEHADKRGNPPGWIEFDYPSGWYLTDDFYTNVQSFDPTDDGPATSHGDRVSIHDQANYTEVYSGNWPAGTVTDTVTIDGITANRYTPPVDTSSGYFSGYAVIDVVVPAPAADLEPRHYYITREVARATGQTDYDARVTTLDAIIDSIEFVDDAISSLNWIISRDDAPLMSTLRQFKVTHPNGWVVGDLVDGFEVSSLNFTAGSVYLKFEPGADHSDWDTGEEMLGDTRIRRVAGSTQVVNGIRTTEYIRNADPPVKITVSVTDLPYGTADYWLLEQLSWRIMYNASVWYQPALPYPGP